MKVVFQEQKILWQSRGENLSGKLVEWASCEKLVDESVGCERTSCEKLVERSQLREVAEKELTERKLVVRS